MLSLTHTESISCFECLFVHSSAIMGRVSSDSEALWLIFPLYIHEWFILYGIWNFFLHCSDVFEEHYSFLPLAAGISLVHIFISKINFVIPMCSEC